MKRIFTASALAMLLTTPAFADAHGEMFMSQADAKMQILGSEFIGARVYVAETEMDEDYTYKAGAEKEWDDVGEINNIVLTRDGSVKAAVIGVGGFLGLGEKDVAVSMDKIKFVSDGEDSSDYFLVFTSSKAALEGAPEWERAEYKERMKQTKKDRKAAKRTYKPADMAALNAVKRDGYKNVKATEMKASDLIGARVYGTKNEDVGEVSDIILKPDMGGKVAIVDVGGFIGIGEKPVAVPMKELRIMREDDGDDLRVYIDATEERLEGMPEYEERG